MLVLSRHRHLGDVELRGLWRNCTCGEFLLDGIVAVVEGWMELLLWYDVVVVQRLAAVVVERCGSAAV